MSINNTAIAMGLESLQADSGAPFPGALAVNVTPDFVATEALSHDMIAGREDGPVINISSRHTRVRQGLTWMGGWAIPA